MHHERPSSRKGTPPPPPFPAAPAESDNPQEDEEKALLIDEILRLERTMNSALRASRDEMESLKDSAAEKRAAIKQMEEELAEITKQMNAGQNDGEGEQGGGRRQQRRQSGQSVCSNKSGVSRVSTATGARRPSRRGSITGLLQQNAFNRRVSVSGDNPFFRRSTLVDDSAKLRESVRRRSDPISISPGASLRRKPGAEVDDSITSSRMGEEGSRGTGRSLSVSESGSVDDSDGKNDGGETDEEIKGLKKTLQSKEKELEGLRGQQASNENQLSYLQSKLQSMQTKTMVRRAEHATIVEALQNQKKELTKSVKRRERLIGEVERCVGEINGRVANLEREIESKKAMSQQKPAVDQGKQLAHSQIEEELRKHQLRLRIHSQYTAKAIESFLKCMETAKEKDVDGLLLDDSISRYVEGGNDEERRQKLVEEIAMGVDIQLNSLESMIREVDEKVEEYKILSSVEQLLETSEQEGSSNDVDGRGDSTNENENEGPSRHPNKLLVLTKECADLMEDLTSTISHTMESTVRVAPHSVSIEFQPSHISNDSEARASLDMENEDAPHSNSRRPSIAEEAEEELPYFQIQRKRLQLREVQRSQLRVDNTISILQNDMQSLQASMEEEGREHHDMMSELRDKLQLLTERLDGVQREDSAAGDGDEE